MFKFKHTHCAKVTTVQLQTAKKTDLLTLPASAWGSSIWFIVVAEAGGKAVTNRE